MSSILQPTDFAFFSLLGSLSKRTFQGDAVVKSEKARDSRRRSRAKFNLLSTGATRLDGLHSQILACLILLSLLWYVLKSFVRFFSYYDASLISDEHYIYLLLTEFEGRTVSYGPSFFLLNLWPKREARGP